MSHSPRCRGGSGSDSTGSQAARTRVADRRGEGKGSTALRADGSLVRLADFFFSCLFLFSFFF